jgi:hypothetical protein
MNEVEKQALIEHAKSWIDDAEAARDEIPFGFDGDTEKELSLFKIALAALTAQPVAIVEPRDYVTAAQLIGEEPLSKSVRPLFEGALFMGQKLYTDPPAPALRVPEGWKLVPVEPSWEMISAAIKSHEGDAFLPVSLYKSMLAAAPNPSE